jgi:lysophospholipase L1-like esterase
MFRLGAVLCAALLTVTLPATASATPRFRHYVALGDSYVAIGSLLTVHGTPGCFRSADNYPADVARSLGAAVTDVSCSSATTEHLTSAQQTGFGTNPPQFDALTADTNLVSVSIGGNDFGFSDVITNCGLLSVTDLLGNPCQRQNSAGGTDQLAVRVDAVAPKVAAVLAGIRARAPRATVVVVGYLPLLPPAVGCWPSVPLAVGDVPYLYGIQRRLDGMLAAAAKAVGALAVDPSGITGHDACQLPWNRWVEPTIPAAPTTPFHPNAMGQRGVANLVVGALGR